MATHRMKMEVFHLTQSVEQNPTIIISVVHRNVGFCFLTQLLKLKIK